MTSARHHPSGRPASWTLPWGFARVRGDSMRPMLIPGDLLLISYRAAARPGNIVVARFVDGTVVVKRASDRRTTRAGDPGWWLLSLDPRAGVDSRHRGVVPETEILGVALARVWPRPRWWAVARSHALGSHD